VRQYHQPRTDLSLKQLQQIRRAAPWHIAGVMMCLGCIHFLVLLPTLFLARNRYLALNLKMFSTNPVGHGWRSLPRGHLFLYSACLSTASNHRVPFIEAAAQVQLSQHSQASVHRWKDRFRTIYERRRQLRLAATHLDYSLIAVC